MTEAPQPVAVPQTVQQSPSVAVVNQLPPVSQTQDDPSLVGFHKLAAARRSRVATPPITVPFGNGTIRVHAVMPAGFAFDGLAAEADPFAAKRLIRDAIIAEDQPQFDRILTLPPNNEEGVDGQFLVGFIQALAEFYGGIPLGV